MTKPDTSMSSTIIPRSPIRQPSIGGLIARRPYLVAAVLAAVLLVANIIALPQASAAYWPGLVSNLAPFALVAIASTPAILGGGIDLSIGPQVVLTNIVIVAVLIPAGLDAPWILLPIVLGLGAVIGTIVGVLVAVLRFPAMIATLCVMFVVIGVDLRLAPQPVSGSVTWIEDLTSRVGGWFPVAALVLCVPFVLWAILGRTAYLRNLLSSGGDPIAAVSAGVPVTAAQLLSYTLGGIFAAMGGVMMTSLLRSGDASQAGTLVLVALAAVALGGTVLTGGKGGLVGALVGATCIFLIQNLLTAMAISALWVNVIYGVLLVLSVVIGAATLGKKYARRAV